MRVQCPYCKCHYDIRLDFLGTPLGNQQLGFGWWLRCYKCHRKFWLSSTKSIIKETPPSIAHKIGKLEKLRKRKKKLKSIIFLIITILALCFAFYQRNTIQIYFTNKIIKLIKDTKVSLGLKDIAYRIDTNNRLYVTGFIVNSTSFIIGLNTLKVNVYDNNQKYLSWNIVPKVKNIIPGDKVFFSGEHVLNKRVSNIKVTVSID